MRSGFEVMTPASKILDTRIPAIIVANMQPLLGECGDSRHDPPKLKHKG